MTARLLITKLVIVENYVHQVKEVEMDRTCSTNGGDEECI
jgi:hypothetical protein